MTRAHLLTALALCWLLAAPAPALAQAVTAEVETWSGVVWRLAGPRLETFATVIARPAAGPPAAPEPTEARRQRTAITLFQGGAEIRVPVTDLATLIFVRHPVAQGLLPSWIAPRHFRHAVTAILRDGTSIESDYVNLGATVIMGASDGRGVAIPWEEIAVLRFTR